MLKAERMIVRDGLQFPWSPALAIAILQLSIWRLIKSELKTKTSRQTKLQQLTTRLHNLDSQYPCSLITYTTNNMKAINKKIKTFTTNLKTIKKNSRVLRDDFLKERIIEAKLDNNQKHVNYLSNLLIIEHQQQMHRSIKHHTKQKQSSGLKSIDIPLDSSIPWNSIPPSLSPEQWTTITNPEEIEQVLTSRNKEHLSQPEGTPFTIAPLKDLLGPDSFTPFGKDLLTGQADMSNLPLSNLQKLYFANLKKASGVLESPISPHISIEDMTSGFRKWKESTTTSPSQRHLGHYKSFLVSDSNDTKTEHANFDKAVLQTINTIINATIASGVPLTRWLTSLVVMIEKIPSVPRINKLRVINIYEADYNLMLKYFWPKQATKHAVQTKTIGENQWGGVPGGSADLVALINEFITETHRLTFHNLVILQNDAKACFDRIINNHSTLHSRKFEIPDKVCKLHSTTLRNIQYRVQTALGIASCHYQNTLKAPAHGSGQGAGLSCTKWVFISVPMMETLEQLNKGCIIMSPNKK